MLTTREISHLERLAHNQEEKNISKDRHIAQKKETLEKVGRPSIMGIFYRTKR